MTNFYIEITNGLLEEDHKKRMGPAVWEFMWILDKITMVDEEGVGWVLGKKPIKLSDIQKKLGGDESTVSQHLNRLYTEGYINLINTGHGLIISVNKAKKRFSRKSGSDIAKSKTRYGKIQNQVLENPISLYIDNTVDNKSIDRDTSINYLREIPEQDIQEFTTNFTCSASQVKSKAASLADYCESKGRSYKNYKSLLRNALRKDYGERFKKQGYTTELPGEDEIISEEKLREFRAKREEILKKSTI